MDRRAPRERAHYTARRGLWPWHPDREALTVCQQRAPPPVVTSHHQPPPTPGPTGKGWGAGLCLRGAWLGGGGGLGPTSLCTENGPKKFVLRYISLFPLQMSRGPEGGGGGAMAKKYLKSGLRGNPQGHKESERGGGGCRVQKKRLAPSNMSSHFPMYNNVRPEDPSLARRGLWKCATKRERRVVFIPRLRIGACSAQCGARCGAAEDKIPWTHDAGGGTNVVHIGTQTLLCSGLGTRVDQTGPGVAGCRPLDSGPPLDMPSEHQRTAPPWAATPPNTPPTCF